MTLRHAIVNSRSSFTLRHPVQTCPTDCQRFTPTGLFPNTKSVRSFPPQPPSSTRWIRFRRSATCHNLHVVTAVICITILPRRGGCDSRFSFDCDVLSRMRNARLSVERNARCLCGRLRTLRRWGCLVGSRRGRGRAADPQVGCGERAAGPGRGWPQGSVPSPVPLRASVPCAGWQHSPQWTRLTGCERAA